MLRLVTVLFTCQVKDFSILRVIGHGCEGAVFLVKCMKESHLLEGKVFAMKVMFNVFSHSTLTQVRHSNMCCYLDVTMVYLHRFAVFIKASTMLCVL